jgi:hypothetical protein
MNSLHDDLFLFYLDNPEVLIPITNVIFCKSFHQKSEHGRSGKDFVQN